MASTEKDPAAVLETVPTRNRYDRAELAGAFGDFGTLIPFVVAYINLVGLDPFGVLLSFGISMIAAASTTRRRFPCSR